MNRTSSVLVSFLVIAACGGSHKPAPPPSNGESSSEAAVAMEPDQVDAEAQADQDALARQQAIQAARDAGVLGNGSGAGSAAAPAPQPSGDPRDKPAIRAVVHTIIQKIQYCYEKQLLAKPGLHGTTTVHFTIAPDGTVSSSTASGFDTDVDTCIAGNVSALKFAAALDAGYVTVNYPFTFRDTP